MQSYIEKEHIKKIFSIFNESEIYLVNTPLQFLNLVEYKFKFSNHFNKPRKIFACNSYRREIQQINFIKKKLKLNYEIVYINKKIYKLLLLIVCFFKKIFKDKLQLIVIGDYENPFLKKIFKFSNKVIFLDDGTNIFDNKNSLKKILSKNSNYYFFSFFDNKFLGSKKFLKNDFLFLKSKIKKIKKTNKILFLGSSLYSDIFDLKTFKKIQTYFLKKYSRNKIYYFLHPKETIGSLKKTVLFKTVKSSLPLELYLILNNEIPKIIISYNSTAFVTLKKIFSSKLKLLNLLVKVKKDEGGEKYAFFLFQIHLKIIRYFKKYLKIKTIFIK
jgi:hypothetical protein